MEGRERWRRRIRQSRRRQERRGGEGIGPVGPWAWESGFAGYFKELEAWAPAHAGLGTTGLSKPKQDPVLLLSISRRLYLSYGENILSNILPNCISKYIYLLFLISRYLKMESEIAL
jgi:hypothetical protein